MKLGHKNSLWQHPFGHRGCYRSQQSSFWRQWGNFEVCQKLRNSLLQIYHRWRSHLPGTLFSMLIIISKKVCKLFPSPPSPGACKKISFFTPLWEKRNCPVTFYLNSQLGLKDYFRVFGCWELSHMIFLVLRKKELLAKLSKFTKWQLFSLKMILGCRFEWK